MILKKYVQRLFVLISLILWAKVGSSQSDSLSVDLGVNVFRMLEWKRSAQLDPDVWNPYLISAGINVHCVTLRA
ncbi:MAG: hypothetical protein ACKOW8_13820, partial [Flavobacteriales bacterium]